MDFHEREQMSALSANYKALADENQRLITDTLLKDKARMDWLDSNNPYKWANSYRGETWRDRIDKARKISTKDGQ